MRKLKLQIQTTIDGYVARLNGDTDWMTFTPDEELITFLNALIDTSDTILLGREMTDSFVTYWESAFRKNPDIPFAKKMVNTQKIVFSKTLEKSSWNNTLLATGSLTEEINNLKNQSGKDLIVYGGAGFVSSLIQEGLIDEYYFIINPVAIGSGMTIFNQSITTQKFTPVQSKLFSGGKTILILKPLK